MVSSILTSFVGTICLLVLAAHTKDVLSNLIEKWLEFFTQLSTDSKASLLQICAAAAYSRTLAFPHRAHFEASSVQGIISKLQRSTGTLGVSLRANAPTSNLDATRKHIRVAFQFSGQSGQVVNISRSLYENYPLFRRHFDSLCDSI